MCSGSSVEITVYHVHLVDQQKVGCGYVYLGGPLINP